eukprot:417926_1
MFVANSSLAASLNSSYLKIDVTEKSGHHGKTALYEAAELGNVNIIRMLISQVQAGHSKGNHLNDVSSLSVVAQTRMKFRTFTFLFATDKWLKRARAYVSQESEASAYFKSEERKFVRWLLDCA